MGSHLVSQRLLGSEWCMLFTFELANQKTQLFTCVVCTNLLRIQVERLMTSVIAFVITVDWLRCEANCPTLLGVDGIDLCVMAIEIKIEYFYYSTKRITPVYIVEEELMTPEYSKFVERIVNEVAHLRRINSMRLTVKEDETADEVDLSIKYF